MSDYMGEYTAMRELLVKADAEVGLHRAEPLREAIEQWKATEENGGVLGRGAWRDGVRYGLEVAAQLAAGLLAEPGGLVQVGWLGPYGLIPGGMDNDPAPHWRPVYVRREVGPWVEVPS